MSSERDFDLVIFGSCWVDLHYVNDVSTLYDDWKQKFLLNFNVKTTCGFFGLLLTPTTAGDQLDLVNLIYYLASAPSSLVLLSRYSRVFHSQSKDTWL